MKKILVVIALIVQVSLPTITKAQIEGSVPFPTDPVSNSRNMLNSNLTSQADDIIQKNPATGNVSVNIPFYTYSIEGIDINIGLSYQTSGIQVDEIASIVGLGWQLNTGGKITRQVRGKYADEHWKLDGSTYSQEGYWWPNGTAREDNEGDVFYLTIGGRSFTFMFSQTGTFLTIPESNIKIDRYIGGTLVTGFMSSCSASDCSLSFVVTDEHGNKFYFDKSKYAHLDQNTIDEWSLSKIVTFENKQITYTNNIQHCTEDGSISEIWQEKNNNFGAGYFHLNEIDYDYRELTTIDFPNGISIDFSYNSSGDRCDYLHGGEMLTGVKIYEKHPPTTATQVKNLYTLNYSYFYAPPDHTSIVPSDYTTWAPSGTHKNYAYSCVASDLRSQYRLKLENIQYTGYTGTVATTRPYYTFEYSKVPLPLRLVGGRDKYGYSNNAMSLFYHSPKNSYCDGYLLMPKHTLGSTDVGMSTDYGSKEIIEGCNLKQIKNASGGTISFSYVTLNSLGVDVGGLAVDKISYHDGYNSDNDQSIKYYYTVPEKFIDDGHDIIFNEFAYDYCAAGGEGSDNWTFYMFGANNVSTGLNGERFCFKYVNEQYLNHSNVMIKQITYQYSGLTGNGHGISDNYYVAPNTDWVAFGSMPYSNKQYIRSWGLGLLLRTNTVDNNYQELESVDYTYNVTDHYQTTDFKNTHKFSYIANSSGSYVRDYNAQDIYYPFSGKTELTQVESKKYYNNVSYVGKTTTYTYDSRNNLVRTTYTNSKGESISEDNVYSYALSGTGVDLLNAGPTCERLLFTQKWKKIGGVDNLIGSNPSGLSIVTGNIVRPKNFYSLASSATAPLTSGSFSYNMSDMASGFPISQFNLASVTTRFDDQGFPIENSDMKGNGANKYNSFIVDNITGNVLAEAQNANYGEIAYCGFESDYSNPSVYLRGNWNFNPGSITTSYSMLGRCAFHCSSSSGTTLNTTSTLTIGKEYIVSYWVYGSGSISVNDGIDPIPNSANPSPAIAVGNYNGWTLYKAKFTARASGGIGMWGEGYIDELRLYPANALMSTHVYLPLKGKTADVSANDNFSTYEYDPFGNLKLVRDKNGNITSKINTVTQGY